MVSLIAIPGLMKHPAIQNIPQICVTVAQHVKQYTTKLKQFVNVKKIKFKTW